MADSVECKWCDLLLQLSDYRIITRENIAGDTTITFEIVMVMIVNNNLPSNLQKDMSLFTTVIILRFLVRFTLT